MQSQPTSSAQKCDPLGGDRGLISRTKFQGWDPPEQTSRTRPVINLELKNLVGALGTALLVAGLCPDGPGLVQA